MSVNTMNGRLWSLVYTEGTSSKFYNIFAVGHWVITQWGRIGYDGQTKVSMFASIQAATNEAVNTLHTKRQKGYELVKNDQDVTVRRDVVSQVVNDGVSAARLLAAQVAKTPKAKPIDGQDMLNQVGHLVENLKILSDHGGDLPLDELLDRWGEISAVWDDLAASYKEADLLVTTVRAQVTQRVMG